MELCLPPTFGEEKNYDCLGIKFRRKHTIKTKAFPSPGHNNHANTSTLLNPTAGPSTLTFLVIHGNNRKGKIPQKMERLYVKKKKNAQIISFIARPVPFVRK